jgi:hypothetical protein
LIFLVQILPTTRHPDFRMALVVEPLSLPGVTRTKAVLFHLQSTKVYPANTEQKVEVGGCK